MSWLRIDDGFPQHPKFEGWKPADKWAFLELLAYCAKYQTKGRVPADLSILPRSVSTRLVELARADGWIDTDDHGDLWVHDWLVYNGSSSAEKVAAYLAAHPEATANDVYKAVGGKREIVLSEVAKQRDEVVPGNHNGGSFGGSSTGSRARAPVPSPIEKTLPSAGTPGTSSLTCHEPACGVVKRTHRGLLEHLADVHGDAGALAEIHALEAA